MGSAEHMAPAIEPGAEFTYNVPSFVGAMMGGAIAAAAGGAGWWFVAYALDAEWGLVAWGIGALSGYLVSRLSGLRPGRLYSLIAVVFSLLGILFGKYLMFFSALRECMHAERMGEPTLFSPGSILFFLMALNELLGLLDILFIYFAVHTAWKLPMKLSAPAAALAVPEPAAEPAESSAAATE